MEYIKEENKVCKCDCEIQRNIAFEYIMWKIGWGVGIQFGR